MSKARLPHRIKTNYLSPYRRHAGSCPGTNDLTCECPIWVQGRLRGKYIRESLCTRSMITAELKMQQMLNQPDGPGGGMPSTLPPGAALTLEQAKTTFLAVKRDRARNTLQVYTRGLHHFCRFSEAHGVAELRAVTPALIQNYFVEYARELNSQRTKISRLTTLRVFFNFAREMDWIAVSPAAKHALTIPKPKGYVRPPFTREEVDQILQAIERLPETDQDRARALILLLLYSGMRISDATFCQRASISPERILDFVVIKNRKPIGLPFELPLVVTEALAQLPGSGAFFFQPDWDYSEALAALREGRHFSEHLPAGFYLQAIRKTTALVIQTLALAGVTGTCHKFRDTFAVNMLVEGVQIYTLSQMLGHSDVKITSDHYLNLVPGYRERMSQATRCLNYQLPLTLVKP